MPLLTTDCAQVDTMGKGEGKGEGKGGCACCFVRSCLVYLRSDYSVGIPEQVTARSCKHLDTNCFVISGAGSCTQRASLMRKGLTVTNPSYLIQVSASHVHQAGIIRGYMRGSLRLFTSAGHRRGGPMCNMCPLLLLHNRTSADACVSTSPCTFRQL